jgi:hypothetical protein
MAPQASAALLQLLAALDLELDAMTGSGLYRVIDRQTGESMGQSQDPQAAAVVALRKLRRSYDALRSLQAAIGSIKH